MGAAYGPGHAFSTSQSLDSVWPLTGILGAGLALGPLAAAAAGVGLGVARMGAVLANGASIDTGGRALSVVNSVVFYTLGGVAAGYLERLLRRAEGQISAARAREEVARTLHDGVLQTLAVVERRATDPALSKLAREQERELRDWLFGAAAPEGVWPMSAPRCGPVPPASRTPSTGAPRSWWLMTFRPWARHRSLLSPGRSARR